VLGPGTLAESFRFASFFLLARVRADFGILEARAPRRAADKCSLRSHFGYAHTLAEIAPSLEPAVLAGLQRSATLTLETTLNISAELALFNQLLTSAEWTRAELLLHENATSLSPAEHALWEGNFAFHRRDLQSAINHFEKALTLDPSLSSARYHYLVAFQHLRQKQYTKAFERFQEAIEIEQDFVDSYVELGNLLMTVEDYAGALTCYTDASHLEPNEVGIQNNMLLAPTEPRTFSSRDIRGPNSKCSENDLNDEQVRRIRSPSVAPDWRRLRLTSG